jgi:hypothetical protein
MVIVAEAKVMGREPLGDLTVHIMQQISERKIEIEMIRQFRNVDITSL